MDGSGRGAEVSGKVHVRQRGAVLWLTVANPNSNELTADIRLQLMQALDAAAEDGAIRAVVLGAERARFPHQVPFGEFDTGLADPTPMDLAGRIESMPVPVVARLQGQVQGAWAELALAAHVRVAALNVKMGFPNVALGLPPMAGASQRLPRITGARQALALLLSGRAYPATADLFSGAIDKVVPLPELADTAQALALAAAETGSWMRSLDRADGLLDPAAYQEEINRRRLAVQRAGRAAEDAIVEMVEAALLLPVDTALALERALFEELLVSEESRGLRHAMESRIRVANLPPGQPVALVGMLRSGAGAVRLAADLAAQGVGIVMAHEDKAERHSFRNAVAANLEARLKRGAMKAPAVRRAVESVKTTANPAHLGQVEVVIDSAPDTKAAKTAALQDIAAVAGPDAVVLSTTRHLDLAALAPQAIRPRVVGLHLPQRPYPARLAELVIADSAARATVARAGRLMHQVGRLPARVRPADGLAGGAMMGALLDAADCLVRHGEDPMEMDHEMRALGFARGPYGMLSDIDMDAYLARQERRGLTRGLSVLMAQAGLRLNTGSDPESERAALDSLVSEARRGEAPEPLGLGGQGQWFALLGAMVNEGARLLDQRVAHKPMLLDMVMVQGYGFPRRLGGPMHAADTIGLFRLIRIMRACAPFGPRIWDPHPLLVDMQRNSRTFAALNR